MQRLFFGLLMISLLHPVIAQEIHPMEKEAMLVLKVMNRDKKPVYGVKVVFGQKESPEMKYSVKTNRIGNAELLLPVDAEYEVIINGELLDRKLVISKKPYQTLMKAFIYEGLVIPELEEVISYEPDTITYKGNILKPTPEKVNLNLRIHDFANQPLPGETILLAGKMTKLVILGKTDQEGKLSVLIPKGDYFNLDFEWQKDHSVLFFTKDRNIYSESLDIEYEGTANIIKREKEKEGELRKIREEITQLEENRKNKENDIYLEKEKAREEELRLRDQYNKLRKATVSEYEVFSNYSKNKENYLSLAQAVKENLVNISITGNPGSTHYLRPLHIGISNNTSKNLNLMLENGRKILDPEETVQDLIIVQKELFVLAAGKSTTIDPQAFCIAMDRSAPNSSAQYQFGVMADENMITLTRAIEKYKYYTPIGQNAVWSFSDGNPVARIAGYDTVASVQMRELVNVLTYYNFKPKSESENELNDINREINELQNNIYRLVDNRYSDYSDRHYQAAIGGWFEYNLQANSNVMVAMFNNSGILVRELYYDPQVKPGPQKVAFKFDSTLYADPVYHFKLIIDGMVKKSVVMENFKE